MAVEVSRLGDTLTHGASIITGSLDRRVNDLPTARLGDLVLCPIHGVNPIISVGNAPSTDSLPTAHIGASSSCGAVVITSSTNTLEGLGPTTEA